MDTPITKRLHISGLTPSITADDIAKRLSTFGTVKAVDGFGLLDAVGQPRKFGYVTIETTAGKLAKCMNVLSGATWKGAKLRLGEAKPDFRERIAAENAISEPEARPRKRRRCDGVYSADMSLVDSTNVDKRGGWKKTSLGRIYRPIRMRPERPLPPTLEELAAMKKILKKRAAAMRGTKTKKPKLKAPPTRARKRTIDMTKWGSTLLKGIFLESQGSVAQMPTSEPMEEDKSSSSEDDEPVPVAPKQSQRQLPQRSPSPLPPKKPQPAAVPAVAPPKNIDAPAGVDLASEKKQTLDFLSSLFGGEDDWDGRESIGSDIDEEELRKGVKIAAAPTTDDFEVVPRSASPRPEPVAMDQDEGGLGDEEARDEPEPAPSQAPEPKSTNLKDLFAPRNEEAGFSLLGHLDIDLELDDEIPFAIEEPSITQPLSTAVPAFQPSIPTTTTTTSHTITYLNPKQPLFFPLPHHTSTDSSASDSFTIKARQRDIFDVIKDNRWDWCDPGVKFYKTSTEEEIRKDWEEKKGDLTRDWKKRAREAGKASRKRKGGVDGDADV